MSDRALKTVVGLLGESPVVVFSFSDVPDPCGFFTPTDKQQLQTDTSHHTAERELRCCPELGTVLGITGEPVE